MSLFAKAINLCLRVSGIKKKYFLPEEQFVEEVHFREAKEDFEELAELLAK